MGEELDAEIIWSDDHSQLTINTNMGSDAALEIARRIGGCSIWFVTHADHRGFAKYIFRKGQSCWS